MLIQKICLHNFLSYGNLPPETAEIELRPLNVVIGPNGSGKSNLIEAFSLLKHAPGQIQEPIRKSGGIHSWLFKKGEKSSPEASVSVAVQSPEDGSGEVNTLHYRLSFTGFENRFSVSNEMIYYEKFSIPNDDGGYRYIKKNSAEAQNNIHTSPVTLPVYTNEYGKALIKEYFEFPNSPTRSEGLPTELDVKSDKSVLAQVRTPWYCPEINYLAEQFENIALYQDWVFGGKNPARGPQKADLPSLWLEPDGSNLALVLNRIRENAQAKQRLLEALQQLYEGIYDYGVSLTGGYAEAFLHEGDKKIPAVRLSDGTLRYLGLLTVLLNPTPPPLVCIEEPELGLHPDILPSLAELLKDASTRMQLIVTTHSDILVDALSDTPEAVLVCEKTQEGSVLRRLDPQELKPWLEKYHLGELWSRGHIGGNRW